MNFIQELYTLPLWKRYAQTHEEAYIDHILKNIKTSKFLVELGAWDGFHLSNTRYFIEQGFNHILIDGDNHGNQEVREHFITRENVIEILEKYNCPKEFDLLCIDLDGNDIYVLEEVLKNYQPSVICAEFNPIHTESVAIRYNPEHTWNNDNFYGFSFAAGLKLAERYGYTCVFQNDNLNMYFVHNSHLAGIEVPQVSFQVTHYHVPSTKNDWVAY